MSCLWTRDINSRKICQSCTIFSSNIFLVILIVDFKYPLPQIHTQNNQLLLETLFRMYREHHIALIKKLYFFPERLWSEFSCKKQTNKQIKNITFIILYHHYFIPVCVDRLLLFTLVLMVYWNTGFVKSWITWNPCWTQSFVPNVIFILFLICLDSYLSE